MNSRLVLIVGSFLVAAAFAVSCAKGIPSVPLATSQEVLAASVVSEEGCNESRAMEMARLQHKNFSVGIEKTGETVKMVQTAKAADGQIIGIDQHIVGYKSSVYGVCLFETVQVSRSIMGKKLVNYFLPNLRSEFYNYDYLVYTDRPLKNGWLREYTALEQIPVEVPNEYTPDKKDLYMTWVAFSEGSAARIPVWGFQSAWVKEGDDLTMLGGKVILRNPNKGDLTSADVLHVLRLNTSGIVSLRGVLFPVSEKTWESFLNYQLGNSEEGWTRDLFGDKVAMAEFQQAKLYHTRAKSVPIIEVLGGREVEDSDQLKVQESFLPSYGAIPRLNFK